MSKLRLIFQRGGVHLPELGLWLDPHEPQSGADLTFISHAHADHIGIHREVILTAPTSKLMQARLGAPRSEHVLPYHEPREFKFNGNAFKITLLPAGHIFGSAMALIEAEGESLLYTGDFKLRASLSSETCVPRPADVVIMETTFGRPAYHFPPMEEVLRGIIRFCQEALHNDEIPVLLGYSLGKSQEILHGLAEAGLPIILHSSVHRLTQIYEQFGQTFPPYEKLEAGKGEAARGKVLLCPPNTAGSALLRKLGKTRSAILTGWAIDPNCRFRYQCDAAFPLSDHADFPDLLEFVEQVKPKQVYTLHGFAADFAQTLRNRGYAAQALSEQDQFFLGLEVEPNKKSVLFPLTEDEPLVMAESSASPARRHPFEQFAQACAAIGADPRKLEKIRLLAEYLKILEPAAMDSTEHSPLAITANWFSGRPFASSQNKVLQIGWSLLRSALCSVAEVEERTFHHVYLKHSDSGETAFELLRRQPEVSTVTIEQVAAAFQSIQAASGAGAKLPLLVRLLKKCTALEGKFLIKVITGDLRIGLKEGLVEEAIAQAFGQPSDLVRQAHLLLGDIGETARLTPRAQLDKIGIQPFRPVKFMLASPEESPTTVWDRMLENNAGQTTETGVWLEDKYDGVRCQLHKVGGRVALYSRDLKEITSTFFDLQAVASGLADDAILDGEILAMRGDAVLPFAKLQRRLGRRQDDLFMAEEVPIKFVAFDLLWLNGESYLNYSLLERRNKLEALALPRDFRIAQRTVARSIDEIATTFTHARGRNNEGLMIKDPASLYTPGRRGLAWLKLKKAYATLDCVVVGAEYGHGKRKSVLSDYTFSVRDEATGELRTIGKAYSGLTDVEISELTQHFFGKVLRNKGRYYEVVPDTVLEIAFDRIQESDRHTSGMALRFPRILRIRTDKNLSEIDTVASARRLLALPMNAELPVG